MSVCKAILERKSVRAFLNKDVDLSLINEAIEVSKFSPSSTNLQPWEIAVVRGKTKEKMADKITDAFFKKLPSTAEYKSYPEEWPDLYLKRRIELGAALYGSLGIEPDDRSRQQDHWIRNFNAFGAPVLLLIFTDKKLEIGSFIDCGALMQSLMLTLHEMGLATCPQASFITYSDIIKETLNSKYDDKILVTGIAVGYEDKDAPINTFRSSREELTNLVKYFE